MLGTRRGASVLLILVSLYDLFAPPLNALIFRQSQTAMLTENFVRSGFKITGLTVNIVGATPALLVVEFPLYNALVGALSAAMGSIMLIGKLVSLTCAVGSLLVLWNIVERQWGLRTAQLTALFFIFSPVGMLVRTAFTPDSIALLFTLIGVRYLVEWRNRYDFRSLVIWNAAFMIAGVVKFPTLVPFIPACAYAAFSMRGNHTEPVRYRMPRWRELLVFGSVFMGPFLGWYAYRSDMMYEPWRGFAGWKNFLVGDLTRFLHSAYYPQPVFAFVAYAVCGAGLVLLASALRRGHRAEMTLFAGIPLFYLLIPTVQYQYHYLYALTPWIAILLARGWETFLPPQSLRWVRTAVVVMYCVTFLIASTYALRHDRVVARAAAALSATSGRDDLAVGLFLHDRNYLGSEMHPELFYLSGRRGWNVAYAGNISPVKIDSVVAGYRDAGATRLVLTTYDSSLEPWFANWIPAALRRNPNYDSGTVQKGLEKKYRLISSGQNFLVFQL